MLPAEGTPRQAWYVFNNSVWDIDHPVTVSDPPITQFPVFARSTFPSGIKSSYGAKPLGWKSQVVGCQKCRTLRGIIAGVKIVNHELRCGRVGIIRGTVNGPPAQRTIWKEDKAGCQSL
jgi:hypothetical protein